MGELLYTLITGMCGSLLASVSEKKVPEIWRNFTQRLEKGGKPVNHDLQKAVLQAYFEATLFVCKRCMKMLGVSEQLLRKDEALYRPAGKTAQLEAVRQALYKAIEQASQAEYVPPDNAAQERLELLLLQPETAREQIEALKAELTQRIISQVYEWQNPLPDEFVAMIQNGWEEKGTCINWFDSVCMCFANTLKTRKEVEAIFQSELIADIKFNLDAFQNQFEIFIRPALEYLYRIDEKTDRIDETTQKTWEAVQKLSPAPEQKEEPEPAYPCMSEKCEKLPPTCKLPKRNGMPFRPVPYFTGRITDMWELHFLLKQKQTAVIEGKPGQGCVGLVTGMGGLGKTQLAVEYVHRFGLCYPGGVFWVNAEQGIPEMILRLCQDAKIEVDARLEEKRQLIELWNKMSSLGQVLIVMDNFPENEALQPRLPPGGAIYVLVTTRRRDLTNYSRICLEILSPEEAIALIDSGERQFGEAAKPLVEALGRLPLALELARNYLNVRKDMSIKKLLQAIRAKGEIAALDIFAKKYADELPTGHSKEVSATIQMSYDLASDFAKKVMQVMAFLAPTPVPVRLLRKILNVAEDDPLEDPLNEAVSELDNLSLLNFDKESDPFIHRLIAGFVRMSIQKDEETFQSVVKAVLAEMSRVEDDKDTAAYRELDKILPHADILLGSEFTEAPQKADIADYFLWHYRNKGFYRSSETYGKLALEIAEKHYEPGHKKIAEIQSNLATVLKDLGKYEAAELLLREVVESFKKNLGADHPNVAVVQSNLATVLQSLGKYEAAEMLMREALESDLKSFGKGHPTVAITQSNLAMVFQALGKYEAAELLLREAFESDLKSFGKGHPTVAITQSNLALVLGDLGKYEAAELLLREVLESEIKIYEPGHPRLAVTKSNLATVLGDLGKYEAAELLLREVLESEIKIYEPGHPTLAVTKSNLAAVLGDLGKYEAVEMLLREVLESEIKIYEPGHPTLAGTKHNLATVLKDMGKDEEAIQLEQEAYQNWLSALGPEHPHTKTSKRYLDKWKKSEP